MFICSNKLADNSEKDLQNMVKELHELRKKVETWRYELTVFLKQNKSSLVKWLNLEVHLQDF